ncbi:hypothetical protein CSA80_04455 [Candidatus Saccharibacteria bacterium]|nr:MAG: hypothetical protein CSA80_04455 [Candidatus Saccharibacteria bacterium]
MPSRLPTPGGDDGTWGAILNDFLSQIHNTDGTLKNNSVGAAALAPSAVTAAGIQDATISEAKLDSALQAKVNGLGGGGTLTLAGDVTGASTATVVERVNGVTVSGTPTNGQVLTATGGTAASWQAPAGGAVTSVAGKTGAVTLVEGDVASLTADLAGKADASHTHAAADITSGTIGTARLGSGTANNTTYLRGDGTWATPSAGSVTLAGDVTGPNGATVVERVNGIAVTGTPSAGQVLKATSPTAASWAADATGGGYVWNFRPETGNVTAASGDYVLADATATGITVTLPVAASGAVVRVKRMNGNANSVQIVPQAPAVIDGSGVGSDVLGNQWDSMEYVSDGTNWYRG